MSDAMAPRGLLNARNRAGRTVAGVVVADFAVRGERVVAELGRDPAAYLRLTSELAALKPLLRAHASPDMPAPASPREQLAEQLLEAVSTHFAQHGARILVALGEANPGAYVRFVGEVVRFRMLATERAPRKNPGEPRREPRQLRIKVLLRAMEDEAIDPNNPRLPWKDRERWTASLEVLRPRMPWDVPPAVLRQLWGEDLAEWFECQVRKNRYDPDPSDYIYRRGLRFRRGVLTLSGGRTARVRFFERPWRLLPGEAEGPISAIPAFRNLGHLRRLQTRGA